MRLQLARFRVWCGSRYIQMGNPGWDTLAGTYCLERSWDKPRIIAPDLRIAVSVKKNEKNCLACLFFQIPWPTMRELLLSAGPARMEGLRGSL